MWYLAKGFQIMENQSLYKVTIKFKKIVVGQMIVIFKPERSDLSYKFTKYILFKNKKM